MYVRKVGMKLSKTKSMTTSTIQLKEQLLKWICERHATNGPLDRQLLRDKAMELASELRVIDFKGSDSWLTTFLKKHGFSPTLTNCIGPVFADYRVWVDLLRSLLTQYRHKDLFNVDELVMYSDFLPSRDCNCDDISSISSQTRRIGVLLCCNSSGSEKLEPLISNPYVLEQSRNDPRYGRYEISCITDEVFGNWLDRLNDEMSNSHRNILLLLSRARIRSLQNFQRLSNVKLVFFPKDFPAQLRPLRGDIFHSVKMTYRRRYVEHIRRGETTKDWTTKEIVESIFEAWKDVPQELIVSSFQRTKFREDESILKIECPEWESLETGLSFHKFVTFDDELCEISNNRNDEEMRFLSCSDNRHYNLRKSRCVIVELDGIDENSSNERNKKSDKTARTENTEGNEKSSSNEQKQPEIETSQDHREENLECRNLRIEELSVSANEDKFSKIVSTEIDDNRTSMECDGNNDVFNNSTSKTPQNSGRIKYRWSTMERFMGNDLRTEVHSSSIESDEENETNAASRETIEEPGSTRTKMRRENVEDFPGEAGPSANGFYDPNEISKDVRSSRVLEFGDEEEMSTDGELRLKILDAIGYCDDIERREDDDDIIERNVNDVENSKRTRTDSGIDERDSCNEDEPTKKRAKCDGEWSQHYENNFVFGPKAYQSVGKMMETSINDDRTDDDPSVSNISKTSQSEIEKRCIFTLEGTKKSSHVSYPTAKD